MDSQIHKAFVEIKLGQNRLETIQYVFTTSHEQTNAYNLLTPHMCVQIAGFKLLYHGSIPFYASFVVDHYFAGPSKFGTCVVKRRSRAWGVTQTTSLSSNTLSRLDWRSRYLLLSSKCGTWGWALSTASKHSLPRGWQPTDPSNYLQTELWQCHQVRFQIKRLKRIGFTKDFCFTPLSPISYRQFRGEFGRKYRQRPL